MNIAREITERLSMTEVFLRYGFQPDRKGTICCPFHHETKPSLGSYANGKRWHCFGCNEGGNAIDFVIKLFNLSFKQAIIKIDYDFNLGLVKQRLSFAEKRELKVQEEERKKRLEAEKKSRMEKDSYYNSILDLWIKNEQITRRYKGTSKCAFDYPPEYWKALVYRQYAAYLLDSIER